MKITKGQLALILSIIVLGTIIAIVVYSQKRKEEKEKRYEEIKKAIEGGQTSDSATSGLAGVEADETYNAEDDVASLYDAHGFFNDDEEAIYAILSGKTKAQIAKIDEVFTNTYGETLLAFLESFLDSEELSRVRTIINSAA